VQPLENTSEKMVTNFKTATNWAMHGGLHTSYHSNTYNVINHLEAIEKTYTLF